MNNYGSPSVVMCQGQQALVCQLNRDLTRDEIQTVVALNERQEDGQFSFKGYRSCNCPGSLQRYLSNYECTGIAANISNFSHENWSQEQKDATQLFADEIIDIKSPYISLDATQEDVIKIAKDMVEELKEQNVSDVIAGGEQSFIFALSEACAENDMRAHAGMSVRTVKENGTHAFEFAGYCDLTEDDPLNELSFENDEVDIEDATDFDYKPETEGNPDFDDDAR